MRGVTWLKRDGKTNSTLCVLLKPCSHAIVAVLLSISHSGFLWGLKPTESHLAAATCKVHRKA